MFSQFTDHLFEQINRHLDSAPESSISKQQFQSLMERSIQKCGLVTREEFEVQKAVLLKTREKLEAIEAEVKALLDQQAQSK